MFRGNPKCCTVEVTGGIKTPPAADIVASTSKKPSFKAVVKGEVKSNVPGWVLRQGGNSAKKVLSNEAFTLPNSRFFSLQVHGVYHNVDVLHLTPKGIEAVQFLQQEIRG
jgi:hypothetical protein